MLGGAGKDSFDGGDPTPPDEEKDEATDYDPSKGADAGAGCSSAKGCP